MDSTMKHLILILSVLILAGCAKSHDQYIEQQYRSGNLRVGMQKYEVQQFLNPPHPWCVKQKVTEDHRYELWDFATQNCGYNWYRSYALLFRDGELVEIRQVTSILDLQVP